MNLVSEFNNIVGDIAESIARAGNSYSESEVIAKRAVYSYNIKSALYNLCTFGVISNFALGILGFRHPFTAAAGIAVGLAGRAFIGQAMDATVLGTAQKLLVGRSSAGFKPFI